jgi:hypothetical protein
LDQKTCSNGKRNTHLHHLANRRRSKKLIEWANFKSGYRLPHLFPETPIFPVSPKNLSIENKGVRGMAFSGCALI